MIGDSTMKVSGERAELSARRASLTMALILLEVLMRRR